MRCFVAEALGEMRQQAKDALPALRAALKDEDFSVQYRSEEAIGMIEPPAPKK